MAKTLTFAGSSVLSQYKSGSAEIRETAQNRSGVMNLQLFVKSGQTLPVEGSEVVFRDDARYLFGGYVSRIQPTEIGKGEAFIYDVEVSDYSWIFNNKVARRAYQNQTLKEIVEDLLDTYLDSSYGFTTTNVTAGGDNITTVTFDHISLRKCFEKLAKLTGWVWYTDYQKNLYFHAPTAVPAPEEITDDSNNHEMLSIEYDTSQVRNSVIVIGHQDGEADSNTTTETFNGDGTTRSWELESKPDSIVSIKINGVSKQFSLDVNERDTDVFVYSFSGQSFRLTDAQTTPVGGGTPDVIEIVYYPRIPIIAQEIDPESIAFFASKDGGDGTYERTIKDFSITSKEEASQRAVQELEDFADPLVNGTFITHSRLLQSGSIFSAGQALTVNSPAYGLNDDVVFLIQEVTITMEEDSANNVTEYTYLVRFGGKPVGIVQFLESLASPEGEVTEDDVILTIESATDSFVTDDDAPTNQIYTGAFEYGPSGSPKGRWNMAEWG